ncbi:MAG: DUF5074 domain-containing protein [Prevotella sp.]
MKFRSIFFTVLCGLAVSTAMTSCSDDDGYDPFEYGSKIALPQHRGYVLNEGSYQLNNACISFFDSEKDTTTTKEYDLYFVQNGKNLGDTGQDIITYNDNVYVIVYGSNYIAKLNKAGVEEYRHIFPDNHGQPRYAVAYNGMIYVTTVGGYIVRLTADNLTLSADCIVGKTPERIAEKDGVLYVAIGNSYDYSSTSNKMAIVSTDNFNDSYVKFVEVMANTQLVCANDNYVAVQGYGADWVNTPLWIYNIKSGKAVDTGEYATYVAEIEGSDKFFCIYSKTDWSTYVTTNTYFYYDPAKNTKEDITSKVVAFNKELSSSSIYGVSKGKDGSLYVMQTLYSGGNGTVYHFASNFTSCKSFNAWGQNPKKVVLVD